LVLAYAALHELIGQCLKRAQAARKLTWSKIRAIITDMSPEPLKKIFGESAFTSIVRDKKLDPWHLEILGSIEEPKNKRNSPS
jgi:hypothetical protein